MVLHQLWIWTRQTRVMKFSSKSVWCSSHLSQLTSAVRKTMLLIVLVIHCVWQWESRLVLMTLIKSLNSITKRDVGYFKLGPFKRLLSRAVIHEWISPCWLVKIAFLQDWWHLVFCNNFLDTNPAVNADEWTLIFSLRVCSSSEGPGAPTEGPGARPAAGRAVLVPATGDHLSAAFLELPVSEFKGIATNNSEVKRVSPTSSSQSRRNEGLKHHWSLKIWRKKWRCTDQVYYYDDWGL